MKSMHLDFGEVNGDQRAALTKVQLCSLNSLTPRTVFVWLVRSL